MTMKQLLLVQFVGVMMLSSCTTYGVRKELSDIESYIMERPDSALTMLEAMDRNDLEQERDKARHALLHAMALDKNYIDVSDDSIAQVAVDYYSKHGLEKYKARSFYYLGIAYYYQKNYTKAILEFTKAEQAAIKSDSLYLGMSLLAQADAYSHTYNDAERLTSLGKSEQLKILIFTLALTFTLSKSVTNARFSKKSANVLAASCCSNSIAIFKNCPKFSILLAASSVFSLSVLRAFSISLGYNMAVPAFIAANLPNFILGIFMFFFIYFFSSPCSISWRKSVRMCLMFHKGAHSLSLRTSSTLFASPLPSYNNIYRLSITLPKVEPSTEKEVDKQEIARKVLFVGVNNSFFPLDK